VRIVQEREQQGNADGLQSGGLDRRRDRRDLLLIQLGDHITLGVDTFADLEPPAARHQHRGRILEQIVQVATGRAPEFQQIAKATRADEARASTFVLQQRIGDHGGRVRQKRDTGRIDTVLLKTQTDAPHHALGKISRSRQYFGDADPAAAFLDEGDIRKRAADVDADPPSHLAVPLFN
jgi:hypothetical protein